MSSLLTHLNGRCYDSLYVYLIYVHLVFSLLFSIEIVANKLVCVSSTFRRDEPHASVSSWSGEHLYLGKTTGTYAP